MGIVDAHLDVKRALECEPQSNVSHKHGWFDLEVRIFPQLLDNTVVAVIKLQSNDWL